MSKAVGIDLGTTNSVVAHMRKKEAKVLDNQDNEPLTPSVVHFPENNEPLVGKLARQMGGRNPETTIYSIKRFMGRNYADSAVQVDKARVPYQVVEAEDGGVEVELNERRYTPQEVSAFILESLKKSAEVAMDEQVTHAVITVPAYFGVREREATRQAGQLAGLEVLRIIPEPTAAALAYGFESDNDDPKTILVYDLGGGTFDVTVMSLGAGVFEDVGKIGDMHLGGDDFDNKIVEWLIEQIRIQHRVDVRGLPRQQKNEVGWQLKAEAEAVKIKLGRVPRAQIVIPSLIRANGRLVDLECELQREEFNRMIQPLVDHSLDLINEAVRLARTTDGALNAILLVGGSTRAMLVQDALRSRFGEKVVRAEVNPMHCVAQGAAIQTTMFDDLKVETGGFQTRECSKCGTRNMEQQTDCRRCGASLSLLGSRPPRRKPPKENPTQECPACGATNDLTAKTCIRCGKPIGGSGIVLERIPVPIGIQLKGDVMEVILSTDMYYPMEEPVQKTLHTIKPNQEKVRLPVYEGRSEVASKNTLVGEVNGDLPSGLPVNTAVTVGLAIDRSGILTVVATLPDQPDVRIEATLQWGNKPRPIDGNGGTDGGEDKEDWANEAQFALFKGGAVIKEGEGLLPDEEIEGIRKIGQQLLQAVEIKDSRNGVDLTQRLNEKTKKFGILVDLGIMRALYTNSEVADKIGLGLANRLGQIIHRADAAKQRRNVDEFVQVVKEGGPVLQEVFEKLGNQLGDLLGRSSSGGGF